MKKENMNLQKRSYRYNKLMIVYYRRVFRLLETLK